MRWAMSAYEFQCRAAYASKYTAVIGIWEETDSQRPRRRPLSAGGAGQAICVPGCQERSVAMSWRMSATSRSGASWAA
jgi:hypothetical protein